MLTIETIPADWQALLENIRGVCPSAVLAGGALRDLDNGREVKDLDIFVTSGSQRDAEGQIELLEEAGFEIDRFLDETTCYPEDQNLEVVLIADLLYAGVGLPVQLIFTNWDTSRIVERFDYGICRLAFDGESIVRPFEYEQDKENQVFRLCRDRPTPISMRGSVHRYARLTAEKYAGWSWWPFESIGDCSVNDFL